MSAEMKAHYFERRLAQVTAEYERELAENFVHLQQLTHDHQQEVARLEEVIADLRDAAPERSTAPDPAPEE